MLSILWTEIFGGKELAKIHCFSFSSKKIMLKAVSVSLYLLIGYFGTALLSHQVKVVSNQKPKIASINVFRQLTKLKICITRGCLQKEALYVSCVLVNAQLLFLRCVPHWISLTQFRSMRSLQPRWSIKAKFNSWLNGLDTRQWRMKLVCRCALRYEIAFLSTKHTDVRPVWDPTKKGRNTLADELDSRTKNELWWMNFFLLQLSVI